MDIYIVDAIQEVNGELYAMSRADDGEMYIVQVDAQEYESGACTVGEVMLDAEPIHIDDCEEAVRAAF